MEKIPNFNNNEHRHAMGTVFSLTRFNTLALVTELMQYNLIFGMGMICVYEIIVTLISCYAGIELILLLPEHM